MPLIDLKNITKKYENSYILNNINLSLDNHEFTVFIGPSGCGKSTLLKLISGLETVTSGHILFNHKDVSNDTPKQRNLSMVFQDYALYPHMNIYDNIAFALVIAKIPKAIIQGKINDVSMMMDIQSLLLKKPYQLSGGQRQRAAMARALVRNTDILLMDEPLSNLDAQLRTQLRNELLGLKKQIKRNVIYVTHDQTEAMTLADKIVVLDKGVIQQYDTPKMIYEKPYNKFVATFLGTPKINILECDIVKENKKIALRNKNFNFVLDSKFEKKLKNYTHHKIYLGIRPHHFKQSITKNDSNFLECTLKYFEYIGTQYIVTANCHHHSLQFELNNHQDMNLSKGSFIIECDINNIHLFDYSTNLRIQ